MPVFILPLRVRHFGRWSKNALPIKLQLIDRRLDVVQRAVRDPLLVVRLEVLGAVPAVHELLHARHVHDPVVQMRHQLRSQQ